ncbi:putative monocarboxylate permease [Aspergillus crustosus]
MQAVPPSEHSNADSTPPESESYPDGGCEAWLVVLGAWCSMLPAFGLMNTVGVFQDWLATHQLKGYSQSSVSWIFSVYIFFLMIGSVQIGPLFDNYGPRTSLGLGSIGLTAALMCCSVSEEYYQFMLSFSVLGGISASMLFTPSVGTVNQWFFQHRALAMAIVFTAGSIGGIIFPLMFEHIAQSRNFPWAIRSIGFLCMALCATGTALQKSRLKPNKAGRKTIDIRVLREALFSFTTIAIVLADIGSTVPLTYLASYARANGMSHAGSYQLMSILNAASVAGRLVPGYAADRYGTFNTMIVTTAVASALTLGLWLNAGHNNAAIVSYAALFGFWSGSAISLCPVCVSQICPKTEDFGKRYGTTYAFVALGTLVSLPVAGAILRAQSDLGGEEDFSGLILYSGLNYGVSFVFFGVSMRVGAGWAFRRVF